MIFQVSELKNNHFLDLLYDELHTIELLYTKRDLWIKQFGYLNLLCTRAIRAIMNYVLWQPLITITNDNTNK